MRDPATDLSAANFHCGSSANVQRPRAPGFSREVWVGSGHVDILAVG